MTEYTEGMSRADLSSVIVDYIPGADGPADSLTIADAIISSSWLERHVAMRVRDLAETIASYYPEDVFLPISDEGHQRINKILSANGYLRDSVSADVMRRAMALVRAEADRMGTRSCNCGASEMRGRVDHLAWCDAAEGI